MKSFDTLRQAALARWESQISLSDIPVIFLGTASCGRAAGAMDVLQTIEETLAELNLEARIVQVGCIGPCYLEPLLDIALPGSARVSYANVTPEKARNILISNLVDGNILPKMAKGHFGSEEFTAQTGIPRFFDLPMLKPSCGSYCATVV